MQDPLLTSALILLILAHGFLIRSCYALHTQLPQQSTEVQTRLDGVSSLLDEALDMMAELAPAVGGAVAKPSPFEAGGGNLLSTLISSMMMRQDHASTPQPQEWEVLQPDPTTPNEQSNQHHEHG